MDTGLVKMGAHLYDSLVGVLGPVSVEGLGKSIFRMKPNGIVYKLLVPRKDTEISIADVPRINLAPCEPQHLLFQSLHLEGMDLLSDCSAPVTEGARIGAAAISLQQRCGAIFGRDIQYPAEIG